MVSFSNEKENDKYKKKHLGLQYYLINKPIWAKNMKTKKVRFLNFDLVIDYDNTFVPSLQFLQISISCRDFRIDRLKP